jgi:hypothetical protein
LSSEISEIGLKRKRGPQGPRHPEIFIFPGDHYTPGSDPWPFFWQ